MAELSSKQIEQIAKIRKESKVNKNVVLADALGTSFVLGTAAGMGTDLITKSIAKADLQKITEVDADSSLTPDEKLKKIKKIQKISKVKQAICYAGGLGFSAFIGWNKGAAAGVTIKHEDELMKKRIAAVIASGNKTTAKK